jgi:hypothetical protein
MSQATHAKQGIQAIARAAAALAAAQGADGGWHSTTYGSLRSGAAVTALAIYALTHAPREIADRYLKRLERGHEFLLAGLLSRGAISAPDGTADYPTYASACLLVAARRIDMGVERATIDLLNEHLLSAQLDEKREFARSSPHYGGWDLMGAERLSGVTSGTNTSLAAFALEGLRECESPAADAARAKAIDWLGGVQNTPGDGGFFFTPERPSESNKAQWTGVDMGFPRSYGSATADGLRCLLYADVAADDERVKSAAGWLEGHDEVAQTPGFEAISYETGWAEGLRFYYYFSLAKALRQIAAPIDRRERLLPHLLSLQLPGGAFRNESARMREDDPLIATSLAIVAASECL